MAIRWLALATTYDSISPHSFQASLFKGSVKNASLSLHQKSCFGLGHLLLKGILVAIRLLALATTYDSICSNSFHVSLFKGCVKNASLSLHQFKCFGLGHRLIAY